MRTSIKLWVDDIRNPPDPSWYIARTYQEAVDVLKDTPVSILSLDHDLGEEKTGYDVFLYIENKAMSRHPFTWGIPAIRCHSANPVGKMNIERGYQSLLAKLAPD